MSTSTYTQLCDDRVMNYLLPSWQFAAEQAGNGLDEDDTHARAVQLANEISDELPHCSPDIVRHCARYGIFPTEGD